MRAYAAPDLTKLPSTDATFAKAPADGVAPPNFFLSSSLPTYVRLAGRWSMPERPRSDCVIVRRGERLVVLEPRHLRAGELVAVGERSDGSEGIYVHATGFTPGAVPEVSDLATRLQQERDGRGYLLWVLGPAVARGSARKDVVWLIENGYVQAVLASNSLAAQDLQTALYGATGEGLHLRAINRIRELGGITPAVDTAVLKGGIMHALVVHRVPFLLAGSLRDDGPLPEVVTDASAAQDALREHTERATGAIMIATALHARAVAGHLPSFHTHRGDVEPMLTVCVDQSERALNEIDPAFRVVAKEEVFLQMLRKQLEPLTTPSS